MKYGLIKNNNVCCIFTADNNGNWLGGNVIYTDETNTIRKTGQEIISDMQLKEIVTPKDYTGNSIQYNYVEQNGKIVLAGLKAEVIAERDKQKNTSRINELKGLLSATDYKVTKYAEFNLLGLESQYTTEEMITLAQTRQAYRDEINTLEGKL